jgi:phosphoesterase RecJ-like protein
VSGPRDVTPAEVADLLRPLPDLLVTAHVNPDGDAVGSALALVLAVRELGGDARYVQAGPIAAHLAFLPGFDAVRIAPDGLDPAPDLVLAVDAADRARVADVLIAVPAGVPVVNIDHHATNTRFGDLNLVDEESASTAEIVYRILEALEAPVSVETATCIYAAIVTDTGRFGYPATTPETHRIAGELLRAGLRPQTVHEPLFRSQPLGMLRLQAAVVDRMGTRLGGRIAWTVLTRKMCEDAGVKLEDAADLVDVPAGVLGVEVAALFRETERTGEVKVSLRSRRDVAVNEIAVRHGGGGHPAAAGFTLRTSLEQARDSILDELEEAVRR